MAPRCWVGGSGNPDDTAHFSTESGGSGGASLPTSADDLYIDTASGFEAGGTIGDASTRSLTCRNLIFSQGGNVRPTPTTTFNVKGPTCTLRNVIQTGTLPGAQFALAINGGGTVNVTLTTNGSFAGQVTVNGPLSCALADNLTCYSLQTYQNFDTAGFNLSAANGATFSANTSYLRTGTHRLGSLTEASSGTVDYGTAVLEMEKTWNISQLTVRGGRTIGTVKNVSATQRLELAITAGTGSSATIGTLYVTAGRSYRFQSGTTWTLTNLPVRDGSVAKATLYASSTTNWGLSCSAGTATLDFIGVERCTASTAFYASSTGGTSTIDGNTTGWTLGSPPTDVAVTPVGITSTPTLGTPTLSQENALTPTGLTSTPTLGTPTVSTSADAVAVTPLGLTATPSLGTPALSQNNIIAMTGLSATPSVGSPALSQTNAFTATGLTATPSVGSPTLSQVNAVTATGLTASPSVGSPAVSVDSTSTLVVPLGLTCTSSLGTPSLSQVNAFAPSGLTSTPTIGSMLLSQENALTMSGLVATPILGSPYVSSGRAGYVCISGQWRQVIGTQVNVGGEWRTVVATYVRANGEWSQSA